MKDVTLHSLYSSSSTARSKIVTHHMEADCERVLECAESARREQSAFQVAGMGTGWLLHLSNRVVGNVGGLDCRKTSPFHLVQISMQLHSCPQLTTTDALHPSTKDVTGLSISPGSKAYRELVKPDPHKVLVLDVIAMDLMSLLASAWTDYYSVLLS